MTRHLFLTSAIGTPGVGESIRQKLGHNKPLKTAFITTPIEPQSEQADLSWVEEDKVALQNNGFEIFDYTITGKAENEIKADLADIEVLYVSGGNDFYLKQQSNKCYFDQFVKEFVESGKPYIGTSAGSIIAGTDMSPSLQITDKEAVDDPDHMDLTGFGLVNFTIMPHWGSPWFREAYLNKRLTTMYDSSPPLILLRDTQYVEVIDGSCCIVDVMKDQ